MTNMSTSTTTNSNNYAVQLVHAETKAPFAEYQDGQNNGMVQSALQVESSKSWIEIEVAATTTKQKHSFRFTADGSIMGYKNTIATTPTSSQDNNKTPNNLWSYKYESSSKARLFCFRRPELDASSSNAAPPHQEQQQEQDQEDPNVLMGEVSVKFLESMYQGSYSERNSFKSINLTALPPSSKSVSSFLIPTVAIQCRRSKQIVETITVHYWAAHRLIQVAVLTEQQQNQAELWKEACFANPYKRPCCNIDTTATANGANSTSSSCAYAVHSSSAEPLRSSKRVRH